MVTTVMLVGDKFRVIEGLSGFGGEAQTRGGSISRRKSIISSNRGFLSVLPDSTRSRSYVSQPSTSSATLVAHF